MTASLVDYHCHLDLYPDFEDIIEECERNEIYTLAVTTTPRAFQRNYELISKKKYVRTALGLHPQLVANFSHEIEIWKEHFNKTRYIGEIGIDAGAKYYKSFELQKGVFEKILELCASSGNKILSIHSVRSAPIVLDMLEKSSVIKKNKVVLHWFSGDLSSLRRAINSGCYFSINTEMLNNERSRELVRQIPIERLLTETDGPFTFTNKRPCRPLDVSNTVERLAGILSKESRFISQSIFENLMELER